MQQIETNIIDLKKLSFYLKYIERSLTDEDLIKDILKYIIPKIDGRLAVAISLDKDSINTDVAVFDPVFNTIVVRMNEIVEYIEVQYQDLYNDMKVDHNILRAYILLLILLHEVEHSKQYMICSDKLDSPYKILKEGYGICFKTILTTPKLSIFNPRKYKIEKTRLERYLNNKDSYLLERNATLEASIVLRDLAKFEEDKIAYKTLDFIYKAQCYTGYEKNGCGTIESTFRELLFLDKYNKLIGEDSNYSDKIRYGFELTGDELIKVKKEYIESRDKFLK